MKSGRFAIVATLTATVLSFSVLSGCGGGGKSSSGSKSVKDLGPTLTAEELGQALAFGGMRTRAVGAVQAPVVAAGSGAVITGVAGGQFTEVVEADDDAPGINQSKIVFASNKDGDYEIYSCNVDGTDLKQLTNNTFHDTEPSISPDGTRIAFTSNRDGNLNIYRMTLSGDTQIRVTNSSADEVQPCWSPDSTRILWSVKFSGDDWDLAGINIYNQANFYVNSEVSYDQFPVWSPDGTTIYFQRMVGSEWKIYRCPATGGSATRVNTGLASGNEQQPALSPDGSVLVFSGNANGDYDIFSLALNSSASAANLHYSSETFWDTHPWFSPDGSRIVFSSDRNGLDAPDLYSMDRNGEWYASATKVVATTGSDALPVWGRSSNASSITRRFIAPTNGSMGTTASGFLFGQQGNKTTSIVTFDINNTALTARSNVRVVPLTGVEPGVPNVVFSITFATAPASDVFNSIKYMNNLDAPTQVVRTAVGTGGAMATAGGAIVSFNAADGEVASVLPYNATRSAGSGVRTETQGDTLVLRGSFPAVLDGQGRNIAPDGAHEVRINSRTGELISAE